MPTQQYKEMRRRGRKGNLSLKKNGWKKSLKISRQIAPKK